MLEKKYQESFREVIEWIASDWIEKQSNKTRVRFGEKLEIYSPTLDEIDDVSKQSLLKAKMRESGVNNIHEFITETNSTVMEGDSGATELANYIVDALSTTDLREQRDIFVRLGESAIKNALAMIEDEIKEELEKEIDYQLSNEHLQSVHNDDWKYYGYESNSLSTY